MRRAFRFGLLVGAALLLAAAAAWAQDNAAAPKTRSVNYFDWFVKGGSWVGYILMVLSVVATAFIIEHFRSIRRGALLPEASTQQIRNLLEARDYRQLIDFTAGDASLLSLIINRALREAAFGYAAMEQAMENALQERVSRLNMKPEVLSILGNTGPLVGLYGTVLGIILAFSDIVQLGGIPEPGELAGSIGVALVATFWGLTVAIPSLVVYAIMKTRIETYATEALSMGRECLAQFRTSVKRKDAESPRKAAAPAAPTA